MTPEIELHIGKLVIDGARPADRHRIAEAVERELARLLSECGFFGGLERNVHIDRLDGGSLSVPSLCRGEELGIEIARSLYRSLNKKGSDGSGSRTGGEK